MQAGTRIKITDESKSHSDKSEFLKKRLAEFDSGITSAWRQVAGIRAQYAFFLEMVKNKFMGFDEFIHVGHGDVDPDKTPKFDFLASHRYFIDPTLMELKCIMQDSCSVTVPMDEKIYWDKVKAPLLIVICKFLNDVEFEIIGAFWYSDLENRKNHAGEKLLREGQYSSYMMKEEEIRIISHKSVI